MQLAARLADFFDGVASGYLVWLTGVLLYGHRRGLAARRRLLLAVLAAAVAQCGLALASVAGAGWPDANLLATGGLLVVALCLRAYVARRRAAKIGEMDEIMRSRLTYAETQAAQARGLLLMSEQIAQVGHWRLGLPANELYWSEQIYRIHGVSLAEYTPTVENVLLFFRLEERDMIAGKIANALSEKIEFDYTARLVRPGGEIRHVMSRGVPQFSSGGELIGLFGVFMDITEQKLVEEDLRLANCAAAQANVELQALALMDSLSGLPNRRQFDVAIEREFKRAHREDNTLALLMIDLDYFKAYNDCYGHQGGDDCLRRTAAVIADVPKRPGDQAARYGGEEFAILLPETGVKGATMIAERMVAAVRALGLEHRSSPTGYVTISCGVAVARPRHDPADAGTLIGRADRALYEAKRSGRDRVCQSAEDDDEEEMTADADGARMTG